MQRSPPQTHLHVPGAPAVLPVLVGCGGVELGIPQVSEEDEEAERFQRRVTLKRKLREGVHVCVCACPHLGTCSR